MGSWAKVKGGGGAANAILKVEKPTRIRFIGPGSVADGYIPEDEANKFNGAEQARVHWAPDEIAEATGGPKSINCAGIRDGCIFHAEPLKWRNSLQNFANVVVYTDWTAATKNKFTATARAIKVFQGGPQVYGQIAEQANTVGLTPDQCDWVISKGGTGRDTAWTATMVNPPLEVTIDLTDFEAQPEYADDELPMLVDFTQFDAFKSVTPAEQRAWYDKLMTPADAAAAGDAEDAPAAPSGAPGAPPAAPATAAPKIALGATGGAKRGPKPGAKAAAAAAAAAPPPPPAAKAAPPPPPPAAKKGPGDEEIAAATGLLAAWNPGYADHLQYVLDTAEFNEDYKAAAQTLIDAAEAEAAPAAPPPPPAAKPKPAATAAAAPNLDELRDKLLAATKKSEFLRNFKNMQKFMEKFGGGAKAVGKLTDVDVIAEMTAMVEAGDDTIQEQLAD